jgi:hypothetical protein
MSARITQGTPAPKAESDSGEALSRGRPILDNRVGRAGCVYDADLRFIVEFGLKVMPGSARFKWQRLVLRMSRPRLVSRLYIILAQSSYNCRTPVCG